MPEDTGHRACVDAWYGRAARGLPPELQVQAFEAACTAVWSRAHRTLGAVTLPAIVDRVLYVAAERHPLMAAIELDETGMRWDALRQRALTLPVEDLVEGLRFVLLELLTVLGNLTGEVLSAPLHAALDALPPSNSPSESVQSANGEDTQP